MCLNPMAVTWSVSPSARAQAIDLHAHGEALRDLAAPPADPDEVADEEREDLVGRDVAPLPRHGAEPVAVPVHRDPDVGPARPHLGGELIEVRRDGLGMEPAEERVRRPVEDPDLAPRGRHQRLHEPVRRAVERVGDDPEGPRRAAVDGMRLRSRSR